MRQFLAFISALFICLSCTSTIEKADIPVASVSISRPSAELVEGESLTLTASVSPSDATEKTISWSSSKPSVASVDQKGTVNALSVGTTVIKASAGGKNDSCTITVISKTIGVSSITLDKSSLSLKIGEEYQLNATINPSNASEKNVSWSSASSSIATVNNGLVKGISAGETEITASCGGKKAVCKVKIMPVEVESISLSKTELELFVGDSETITATINPENATNKQITWTSSDSRIATVSNGKITGVKKGSAVITAKAGEKTAQCTITVKDKTVSVTSIELNNSTMTLPVGDVRYIIATVFPSNASDVSLNWKSSNTRIATVDDGQVKAVSEGNAIISVSAGSVTAQCQLNVIKAQEDAKTPLCLTAFANTTITITNPYQRPVGYSFDTLNWTESEQKKITIDLKEKESVYLHGDGALYGSDDVNEAIYFDYNPPENLHILCSNCYVSGNVVSLMYFDGFSTVKSLPDKCTCRNLFRNSTLKNHPDKELILPITNMPRSCYASMFQDCTQLQHPPRLPAENLSTACYAAMFKGCTSLEYAPELKAKNASYMCYSQMFSGCTSLTSVPNLPATTVGKNSYEEMFSNCTNLTTVPESLLPATIVGDECYKGMFNNCTGLTNAPALPATAAGESSYQEMFRGCSRLMDPPKEIRASSLGKYCCMSMFAHCTALKTAPKLPSSNLGFGCYREMFAYCTSLVETPELPASSIPPQCYLSMFEGCSTLTRASKINVSQLTYDGNWRAWVEQMFKNCKSLRYIHFSHFLGNVYNETFSGVAPTGTFVTTKGETWKIGYNNYTPAGWTIEYVDD